MGVRGSIAGVAIVLLLVGCGAGVQRELSSAAQGGVEAPADACLSKADVDRHWRETGRDYKPGESCDDEPGNAVDADLPHKPGVVDEEPDRPEPMSFARAQRELDPSDDSQVILRREPDGTWSAIVVATSGGKLPDWVKTSGQMRRWLRGANAPAR